MLERVAVHPDLSRGKPVVRGTCTTVQTVFEFLTTGDSVEDVLEDYPRLTRDDVQACLAYALKLAANHYAVLSLA